MVQKNIMIKEDTKTMLDSLGEFKETYDDIIKKLIKHYNKCDADSNSPLESKKNGEAGEVARHLIDKHKKIEGWE